MANEFIIKNGFISKGDSIVNGTISGNTFNLIDTPVNNNGATEILVRNTTTGNLEYRDSSTLGGGGGGQTITGYTYNPINNTFSIGISGSTPEDATIDIMSGLTINGNLFVSGDTSVMDIKQFSVIISGDTVFAAGQMGTQDLKVGERGISDKVDIGGDEIIIDTDTLNLQQTLSQNNTETQLLVRNSTTGNIEYRDSSTLSGGSSTTNTFVSGGTFDSSTSELTFTNTTGGTFNVDLSSLSGGTLWQTENGGLKSYTPTTGSINGTSTGAFIAGGFSTNEIFSSIGSTILNGSSNVISGSTTSALLSTQSSSIKSNPSALSDISHATIVGGFSNTIEDTTTQPSERATLLGGSSNIIDGGLDSAIIGGSENTITKIGSGIYTSFESVISGGSRSAIIGGTGNILDASYSVILGGQNIVGTTNDTVYVPNLNIGTVGGGTPLINLGLDSNGNIVTGTTGGGGTNTFVTGGTLSTDSLLTLGYNNGGFANPIDLSTLMDGGDTITGFTYDKNTNTFSIGVSGKTSFDSQILKVSGITVENSMELGEYIVHSGDTNTYFGFNGTDSIVAFTNASRKLRIGTNAVDLEYNGSAKLSTISNGVFIDGRVGVGTDSPQQSLDVRGNVLLSNPGTTTVLTLSGDVLNATYIDFDNAGASTPFARVEGRTYGGGTSGSLNFDTFPSGGALSQVMILTNNQRVGIGDLGNNDVEELLHVEGGDFLISNTQRFYSVLNTNTPLVRFSGQTDDLVQLNVATYNGLSDSGIGMVSRGYSEASFPGYGKQGDGSLYSSIAQNGLNIISAPGTDTEDYIRFFAGNDADGNTANMFIAGTGSTKGFIGINTETPTERLHIAGSIRIVDGTEQNGYVLTCDANGVGSWQPSSGGTGTVYWQPENGGLKSINQNAGSISGTSTGAILIGGYFTNNNITNGLASTIINGGGNTISGANASSIISTISSTIKSQSGTDKIEYSVIMGGSSNNIIDTTNDSDRSVIIGGTGNNISNSRDTIIIGSTSSVIDGPSTNGGLYSTSTSTGTSMVQSVIVGGSGHNINGVTNSGIIGGTNNTLTGGGSVILGGSGLTGTTDNTVFVPTLNINALVFDASPVNILGVDTNGNVVSTTVSGSTTSFWEESGSSNEVLIDKKGSSSYTVNGESNGAIIAAGTGHTITNSKYASFLGGVGNVISNSTSTLGADTQLGGFGNTISGTTALSYNNVMLGGSSNIIFSSARGAMLSTSDSRMSACTDSFILGGSNHKNGSGGNGLAQNDNSGIVGGTNHTFDIGVDRSVIIGGTGLNATTNDTVYVPKLNINSIGAGTPIGNLGFDSSGNVVTGTTGGAAFSWSDPVVTSGNTNADCIDDLYVTNLHSCSPLFINPGNEGDVYFGSSSGVTIQTASAKLGIGTTNPISKLHINEGNALISNENGNLTLSSTTASGGGEYENNLYFRSAGSISFDASIRSNSDGSRGSLYFATTPATGTLEDRMVIWVQEHI